MVVSQYVVEIVLLSVMFDMSKPFDMFCDISKAAKVSALV